MGSEHTAGPEPGPEPEVVLGRIAPGPPVLQHHGSGVLARVTQPSSFPRHSSAELPDEIDSSLVLQNHVTRCS